MGSWRGNSVLTVSLTPFVTSLVSLMVLFSFVKPVFPTSFVFDGFNGTNLILHAAASLTRSHSALSLTNHTRWVLGRALYSTPVQMKSNKTLSSFSTNFVFSMVNPHFDPGGHGIAFFVTPYTTLMGCLPSEYLGLLNITNNRQPYTHLFAVEFDTVQGVEMEDPDDNHVGVDINSLISVKTEHAGYWSGEQFHGFGAQWDFGLARLYEHSGNPGTTRVVGTLGYIAPELTKTAKVTPSSDVFIFGVLLLEVACGRKPVDLPTDAERHVFVLVNWVWELYGHASLLAAADPKLGKDYDAGEMEKVLKLGLLCSNTEPKARPGIRQVCQILEGEAPLPDVHMYSNGYAATAIPEDRLLQQFPSRSHSNGWLSPTSLSGPR